MIKGNNSEGEIMKAVIRLDVPDWQIGQEVTVFFKDTMEKRGKCEADEIVRCKDCWKHKLGDCPFVYWACEDIIPGDNWFCADGERRNNG